MEKPKIPVSAIEGIKPLMKRRAKERIREWLAETGFVKFAEEIEKRIIAQPELKRACYNIYTYLQAIAYDSPIIKCNMLLAGPSGCGKTEFYRAIKDYFSQEGHPHIPVTCVDMTAITTNGFKGGEPSEILKGLLADSSSINGFGIVFMDEFDKRLIPCWTGSGDKKANVAQEVQNGLLKIVEGADVMLPSHEIINTERLCFIGMGSFEHFRKHQEKECDEGIRIMGFGRNFEIENTEKMQEKMLDLFESVTKEDIVKGGGTIELLARFSHVVNFKPMSGETLGLLIEKIRRDVVQSIPFIDVELMPEMIAYLKTQTNTEYGVRRVDELIRNAVITASMDFYMTEDNGVMLDDEILAIMLLGPDKHDYCVRKMTEEESEYYAKFQFTKTVEVNVMEPESY